MKCFLITILLLISVFAFAGLEFRDTAVMVYSDLKIELTDPYGYSYEFWARISGSGSIIYSSKPDDYFLEIPQTLIMTNYHVIELNINPDALSKVFKDKSISITNLDTNEPLDEPDPEFYTYAVKEVTGPYIVPYYFWKRTNSLNYEVEAEIDKYDSLLDIAILKLEDVTGLPSAKFAKDSEVGETIYIFGAPLGYPFQLTKGILGQKHFNAGPGWEDMLRYDAAQAPGSSGSAIFNENGEIIGVVKGHFVDASGSGYEGQNLGIDAANIKGWLWLSGYQFIL